MAPLLEGYGLWYSGMKQIQKASCVSPSLRKDCCPTPLKSAETAGQPVVAWLFFNIVNTVFKWKKNFKVQYKKKGLCYNHSFFLMFEIIYRLLRNEKDWKIKLRKFHCD